MAKLYPAKLGNHVKSMAERRFREECRRLPDNFVAMFGLSLFPRAGSEAEADVVIGDTTWGYLVVEVKGGAIEFDRETGTWYSTSLNGKRYEIKDPVRQAQDNAHAIERKLKTDPRTSNIQYRFGWAVAFPDVSVSGNQQVGPIPRERIIDSNDLRHLETRLGQIERQLGAPKWNDVASGKKAVDALVEVLCPAVRLPVDLSRVIDEIEGGISRLTEAQVNILTALEQQKEALISGCAGSGKTFLAMIKAQQFYEQGLSVLLTCFNRPLADWIKPELHTRIRNSTGNLPDLLRLEVGTFHSLCRSLAARAGLNEIASQLDPRRFGRDDPQWAEALTKAAERLGPQFDAIIVDEGQDFDELWWVPLDLLRRKNGAFYIFYDDNQRLYSAKRCWPIDGPSYLLPQSVRFTRPIHDMVVKLYQGRTPNPPDVPGPEPRIYLGGGISENPKLLSQVLHEFFVERHVSPRDFVILTPLAGKSQLSEGKRVGNYILTWDPRNVKENGRHVLVSSIWRFKGLERPGVVLAEIEVLGGWGWDAPVRTALLYTGMSRARAILTVLGGQPEWFESIEAEALSPDKERSLATVIAQIESGVEPSRRESDANASDVSNGGPDEDEHPDKDEIEPKDEVESSVSRSDHGPDARPHETQSAPEPVTSPNSVSYAVLRELRGEAWLNDPGVQAAINAGLAARIDSPPGLLMPASGAALPTGPYLGIEKVARLPFSQHAWFVRVIRKT